MTTRGWLALAIATVLASGVVQAAIQSGPSRSPRPKTTHPIPQSALSDAQRRLAELKRITEQACGPRHRQDAIRNGAGMLCVPWDSIPAIDRPSFAAASSASFLNPDELVVAIQIEHDARAYPGRFIAHHEIVNDVIGAHPVVVSFCPLCNSAVAFERRAAGRTLTFGVSGQLDYADLVMFDRETISEWTQITGKATNGPLSGSRLDPVPVQMVSFGDWRAAHPTGRVMTEPRDGPFDYGTDGYSTYGRDPSRQSFVLDPGTKTDPRLPPMWRVVGTLIEREAVAFPSPPGRGSVAVQSVTVGGVRLVAFWRWGARQRETEYSIDEEEPGWAGTVWISRLASRSLRFSASDGTFIERTTGSHFSLFGRALDGPLSGRTLIAPTQLTSFWFAWSHFYPDTAVRMSK